MYWQRTSVLASLPASTPEEPPEPEEPPLPPVPVELLPPRPPVADEPPRPPVEQLALQRRGERRAGRLLDLERGEIGAREARVREDALVLHRHQHRVRDAFGFREREIAAGVELPH